ncbi:MAG: A/G-specific adenine glycosylase [Polyangiaceae bacterium]
MSPRLPIAPAAPSEPVELLAAIGRDLLAWYERHRRDLPWRRSRDPYRIWVSEIMLQQTQVATVIGFYERWMQRFPDVSALARADTDAVLSAWEGLGYYSRARNLLAAARRVVDEHGGQLPREIAELRGLPGIGRYSAGAIASIAYDAAEPAVDGNIVRVLTRLFCLEGDPKRAPLAERIWELARRLIPEGRARDFNQALMELGATCCTPKSPSCGRCPVAAHCEASRRDAVERFPASSRRPVAVEQTRTAAVIRRGARVLCVRQPTTAARWAGLWTFPETERAPDAAAARTLERFVHESTGLDVKSEGELLVITHQVTRFRITLEVHACRVLGGRGRALGYAELAWCEPEALTRLAMPTPHRKIARSLHVE